MYVAALWAHSWLRYAVLALGIWLLVVAVRGVRTGAEWSPAHERLHVRFLATLDTQMLLGLLLYFFLSPIAEAARADLGAALKNPELRFFGVEHITAMLLAVVAAHAGRVRARRKHGKARHRTTLIAQLVWLVLTLAAIPWPALDIGRPMFRF